MPRFFALTSRGLVDTLETELKSLGFGSLSSIDAGVFFETDWEGCYRANLQLRSATRVLLSLPSFRATDPDRLYDEVRKHDFTRYIDAKGTLAVDAVVNDSPLRDQRFVAMRVKDAVVDEFTEAFGERPDVDKDDPDLLIWVRAKGDDVMMGIDTSGLALFKRGYRDQTVPAPLKEHMAAALLKISGWHGEMALVDPMCGSGTFLAEAALIGLNIAPGSLRRKFGFQNLLGFDKKIWERVVDETMQGEKETLGVKLYGYDHDREAVQAAKQNMRSAGVDEIVEIKRAHVETLEPPEAKGLLIVNPPYGERLVQDDEELLLDLYRNLGFTLKTRFKGWSAWVLTNREDCSKVMGLKASYHRPVLNGSIPCHYLRYDIRA